MNYKVKISLFITVFVLVFFTLRSIGGDFYVLAHQDLGGIGWLFSNIGLIFSILSGFLIQHLWDKWERIQKIVIEEIQALEHILLFSTQDDAITDKTKKIVHLYIEHVVNHEWSAKTRLLDSNRAILELKELNKTFPLKDPSSNMQNSAFAKLINSLFYIRERRILLATRRMPYIIKNTFLLSAVLVISLSLFVAIQSVVLDLIFTLSIGTLVFAIYLIVDDMDNILSPGAWHVSSKLYKEFLKKLE